MSGRIRTLKPERLEDERLASLPDSTRLLSVALILLRFADVAARFEVIQ